MGDFHLLVIILWLNCYFLDFPFMATQKFNSGPPQTLSTRKVGKIRDKTIFQLIPCHMEARWCVGGIYVTEIVCRAKAWHRQWVAVGDAKGFESTHCWESRNNGLTHLKIGLPEFLEIVDLVDVHSHVHVGVQGVIDFCGALCVGFLSLFAKFFFKVLLSFALNV